MPEITSGKTYAGRERLAKARQYIEEQLRKWNTALALNNAEWHQIEAEERKCKE